MITTTHAHGHHLLVHHTHHHHTSSNTATTNINNSNSNSGNSVNHSNHLNQQDLNVTANGNTSMNKTTPASSLAATTKLVNGHGRLVEAVAAVNVVDDVDMTSSTSTAAAAAAAAITLNLNGLDSSSSSSFMCLTPTPSVSSKSVSVSSSSSCSSSCSSSSSSASSVKSSTSTETLVIPTSTSLSSTTTASATLATSNISKQPEVAAPSPKTAPTSTATASSPRRVSTAAPALSCSVEEMRERQERDEFERRLIHMHRHRHINTPLVCAWPHLNGKPLDLRKLYTCVSALGGWERVCERNKWADVCAQLDNNNNTATTTTSTTTANSRRKTAAAAASASASSQPRSANALTSCYMAEHALKYIYVRFLSSYERLAQAAAATASSTSTNSANAQQMSPGEAFDAFMSGLAPTQLSGLLFHPQVSLAAYQSATGLTGGGGGSGSMGGGGGGGGMGGINGMLGDEIGMGDEANKRKFSYLCDTTPMTYNVAQHLTHPSNVNATSTSTSATATATATAANNDSFSSANHLAYNPYEKLEMALTSGLANEVDFAFNTLLLLSASAVGAVSPEDECSATATTGGGLRLYATRRLVPLMLAHCGFFGMRSDDEPDEDVYQYRRLYESAWNDPAAAAAAGDHNDDEDIDELFLIG